VIKLTQGKGDINTAFIERLNGKHSATVHDFSGTIMHALLILLANSKTNAISI
jgi:hypothetical protein